MKEKTELPNQKKNHNALRKVNLQVWGNIGRGQHHTSENERKKIKKRISGEREIFSKPNYIAEISLKG